MRKITFTMLLVLFVSSGIAQSLKFRFTFDDKLTDETANAYVLTPGAFGSTTYVQGKFGKAVQLNGVTDYFDLLTGDILNPAVSSFTACAWVYNEQPQSDWVMNGQGFDEEQIIHQLNGASDTRGRIVLHHIINETNSTIQTVISNSLHKADDNSFAVGKWQHVAIASDPATKNHKFYINGQLVGDKTTTPAFESCTGGFRFGAHKLGNGSFWHGKLDEICLFEGILTDDQIQKVMQNNFNITSLTSLKDNLKIRVFPIPAKDKLSVDCGSVITNLTLFGLDGRVLSIARESNQMNISNIQAGNYLLKISTIDGDAIYEKVLISK